MPTSDPELVLRRGISRSTDLIRNSDSVLSSAIRFLTYQYFVGDSRRGEPATACSSVVNPDPQLERM